MSLKLFLGILILVANSTSYGQSALSYSGRLVNADGSPVSGPVNLRFELAYTSNSSVILCSRDLSNLSLAQGVFHVKLEYTTAQCGGTPLVDVLRSVAPGDAVAIRVTDLTPAVDKVYGFQALHSMPFALVAEQAKNLGPMGATTAGQVLRWDGSQWVADTIDEVAPGSIGSPELADGSVTSAKIADLTITGADVADGSLPQSKITGLAASFTGKENALGTATSSEYLAGDRSWRDFQNDVRATFVGMGYAPILAGGAILSTDSLVSAIAKLDGRISNAETAQGDYVSLAGDTMTGPLVLNADPSLALGAATKQYVDAQITAVSAGSSQWDNIAGGINYAGGDVGVGTATPSQRLHVASGNIRFDSGFWVGSNGNNNFKVIGSTSHHNSAGSFNLNLDGINAGSGDFNVRTGALDGGGALIFKVQRDGNVGIGVSTPTAKLEVAGQLKITGGAPGENKILTSDATGLASWMDPPSTAPSGAAGGDLDGSYPNPVVRAGSISYDKTNFADNDIPQVKVNGLVASLAGKEPAIAAGTAAQYLRGDKTLQTLNTSVVPEGTNLYFTEPRVLGTPLAGFTANTSQVDVTSADSALVAFQKLQSSINAILTGSVPFESNTNFGGFRLTNVGTPTDPADAATKAYVDSLATAGASKWTNVTGGINYASGNVGVGTTTPNASLDVRGSIKSEIPGTNSVLFMNFNPSSATPGLRVGVPVSPGTIPSANYITAGSFDVNGNMRATGPGTTRGVYVPINTQSTSSDYGVDVVMNGSNYSTPHGFKASVAHAPTGTNSAYGFYADVTNSNGSAFAFYANNGMSYFNGLYLYNNGTNSEINTANGGSIILGGRRMVDLAQVTNIPTIRLRPNVTGPGVGIGVPETETLEAPLHIKSNGGAAVTTALLIGSSGNSGAGRGQAIVMRQPNSNSVGRDALRFSAVDDGLRIATGAGTLTDHVRIDAVGNTGFGIMFPTTKLHVSGSLTLGNGNETCTAGNFAGAIRYDGGAVEFCNGAAWTALASAGGSTPADNTVTSAKIVDGSIVDADVAAGAAIAQTKIANLTTDLAAKQPLDADLTALAGVATNGVLVRTGTGTAVTRSLAGTANRVSVTNADGVAGNPTIDVATTLLPSPLAGDTGRVLRVTGANTAQWQALASGDITAALGFTPINKAGDTMPSGVFDFTTSSVVRVLNPVGVTDVANKQYVDGQISGASNQWAQSGGNVYRSTGNVGVGAAAPSEKFVVNNDTGAANILIRGTTALGTTRAELKLERVDNPRGAGMRIMDSGTASGQWWAGVPYNGGSASDMFTIGRHATQPEFNTSSLFTVAATGNVGIGTNVPNAKLEVQAATDPVAIRLTETGGTHAIWEMRAYNTTLGGANNQFSIWGGLSGATLEERLVIEPDGNVGIGTTDPAAKLVVSTGGPSAPYSAATDKLIVNGTGNAVIQVTTPNTASGGIYFSDPESRDPGGIAYSHLSDSMVFRANGGTRMTLNADGFLGVGTGSPQTALDILSSQPSASLHPYRVGMMVSGQGTSVGGRIGLRSSSSTEPPWFIAYRSRGTLAAPATVVSGDTLLGFLGSGYDGTTYQGAGLAPEILMKTSETWSNSAHGSEMLFYTVPNGTTTSQLALTIANSTSVGIGTSAPSSHLHVSKNVPSGYATFAVQNTAAGGNKWSFLAGSTGSPLGANKLCIETGGVCRINFDSVGNMTIGGTLTQSSDLRLKREVEYIPNSLKSVLSLSGVTYYWEDEARGQSKQIGLIAQDVEKVFPEAVSVDNQGFRSVAYQNLVAPVINSLKEIYEGYLVPLMKSDREQNRKIAGLEEQNKKQQEEIKALKDYVCSKDPSAAVCR